MIPFLESCGGRGNGEVRLCQGTWSSVLSQQEQHLRGLVTAGHHQSLLGAVGTVPPQPHRCVRATSCSCQAAASCSCPGAPGRAWHPPCCCPPGCRARCSLGKLFQLRTGTSLPRLLHASLSFPFLTQVPFRYLYSVILFPLQHCLSRPYKLNSLSLCP